MNEKVKDKLLKNTSDDGRSVISSDNDLQSTSHRRYLESTSQNTSPLKQSSSSQNRKAKKFVIKKSSVREENGILPGNYRVSNRLAGILEQQLQFLINSKKESAINCMTGKSQGTTEAFLPYKNIAQLLNRQHHSKSQRSRRKLTVSTSKIKQVGKQHKSDNVSARSNTSQNKHHTPRYQGNQIRLIKGKEKIVSHHKKSAHYNDRSRQVHSSGLRSNSKSRPVHAPNLLQTTSA